MKRNKKSVSVKNTKSFLGNPPALVNTTFFVPAVNLNANDGIFTDLHDNPSNFSSSNQDPNWDFDISNRIFAQSDKKKIFSDDKFKNMTSKMPDMYDNYTTDLFSGENVPVVINYNDAVQAVSPVLSEVNYPTYYSDVEPQPVSVGIAPVDGDFFAVREVGDRVRDESLVFSSPIERYVEVPRPSSEKLISTDRGNLSLEQIKTLGISEADFNRFSDADLIKLIGQEKFDSEVASKYKDGVLINAPDSPEMADKVPTASIQPTTVEEDKKAKKPYNWLPIALVVAAVGGYMYYNRKK